MKVAVLHSTVWPLKSVREHVFNLVILLLLIQRPITGALKDLFKIETMISYSQCYNGISKYLAWRV